MKYNKIYIFTNDSVTGGPENLQQLCNMFNVCGQQSYIYYYEHSSEFDCKHHRQQFAKYNNPIAETVEDSADNLIVVPECSDPVIFNNYKHIHKCIFWLAAGTARHHYHQNLSQYLLDADVKYNFVQSEWAYLFLASRGVKEIVRMSDYIADDYLQPMTSDKREDIVLFNPRKDMNVRQIAQAVIAVNSMIKFIPITGMSRQQIITLMDKSKVYIDFGNHPGKDRLPREAALRNLILIVGRRGSADNPVDIPIPNEYKFQCKDIDCKLIADKINDSIINYNDNIYKFSYYQKFITDHYNMLMSNVKLFIKE